MNFFKKLFALFDDPEPSQPAGLAALPLELQNYINICIANGIKELKASNDAEIRRIEKDKWEFWKKLGTYVALLGWVITIVGSFLAFAFGKQYLRAQADQAVQRYATTEAYRVLMADVRTHVANFTTEQLIPLTAQIRTLDTRVADSVQNADRVENDLRNTLTNFHQQSQARLNELTNATEIAVLATRVLADDWAAHLRLRAIQHGTNHPFNAIAMNLLNEADLRLSLEEYLLTTLQGAPDPFLDMPPTASLQDYANKFTHPSTPVQRFRLLRHLYAQDRFSLDSRLALLRRLFDVEISARVIRYAMTLMQQQAKLDRLRSFDVEALKQWYDARPLKTAN